MTNEERAINVLAANNKLLIDADFSLAFNSILDAYMTLGMKSTNEVHRVEAYYGEYIMQATGRITDGYEDIFNSDAKL